MTRFRDRLEGLTTAEIARLRSLAKGRGIATRPGGSQSAPISRVPRAGRLALSFAQQRLWFLAQLGAGATYHIPISLRLVGALDKAALRRSLGRLVARHEALRSVVVSDAGAPHVELLPEACGVSLVDDDLRDDPQASERLAALRAHEATAPFDLARGPLIRGRLVRISDEEHVLLVTQHHIVSDGWSMGVFKRELGALYRAFAAGQDDPLPPLEIQYPDYAAWQRAWLSGDRLEAQVAYWRRSLAGAPALLALPTDRPRPPEQSFAAQALGVHLDAELTRGLRRVSQEHGTTLFMTLLAAWAAVLARLAGQDDVVIGTPTANRSRREIEGLIGFFVNTLALRIDLSGAPSLAELVARVRTTALGAQDHQDLPFEQVVEIVAPPRRLDHTPVFQVMFAWQNQDEATRLELPGLALEPIGGAPATLKFDLELTLGELDGAIAGGFLYSSALFDASTIERHRGYLEAVLRALVADASQPVTKVDLISPAERTLLVETWNDTAAPYPRERCIHQLFEEQVRRTPEAIAVVEGELAVSYAELDRRANRLAHRLIGEGIQPGDCVATLLERGVALVVAELAILKAGGAYVPLDPQAPAARRAWVVADCAARRVLTEEDCVVEAGAASDPELALSSEATAYVMYTSGSTGLPKGVAVPHRAVNRLVWNNGYAEFLASDRVAWVGNPAFDISTLEMWAPLLHGGCLVIVSRESVLDAAALRGVVSAQRVSVLHLTSGLFAQVVDVLGDVLATLRVLLVGGDVVDVAAVRRVLGEHAPEVLLHCYGPTESTTFATTYRVTAIAPEATRLPIGRPIGNTQIYLLDGHGALVPVGAVGELYVGGAGVARGYLDRPALTAERFVADRFGGEPGARLYRTGDLARYQSDGNLEFLGRADQQVKIRGYRIELGEIEARLSEHRTVRDAVVIAREDTAGDKRLVAYVTSDAPAGELVAALRQHLAEQLPEYMVPAAFVRLAELPLTPNGKLDRNALPAPDGEALLTRAYEAPVGEVEAILATVWAELLGLERVGRHDHFFELGGHSLLAVKLMERLRRLGLGTAIRNLFAAPILSQLAATLGSHVEVAVPPNVIGPDGATITPEQLPLIELTQADIDRIIAGVPGGVANIQDIYALSPLQEGILFHHLLASAGDPYLLVHQLAFANRAVLERYLAAVQEVVNRHDILRTALVWDGQSAPAQVVWRTAPLVVTEVALAAGDSLARRFDPRQHRMDLTTAPLLRYAIAQEPGSARYQVLELQHHLIGDHSTLEILHAEVRALLGGRGADLGAPQPFRNLVAQARLGVGAAEHERFFREQLGDIDEPTTPFGLREVHRDGSEVSEARRRLPAALNDRLRAQARRLGVSLASLCHVAFGQVVARTSGREQVVFGTVLFGRMHAGPGADRAMGLFINTLPIRLDLDATAVDDSVRRTHARLAELLRHEHAALALAQRCSGVAAPAPLFSALLNYRHGTPPVAPDKAGDALDGIEWLGGEERTNYPLTLSVNDFGEALGLTAHVIEPVSAERVCDFMERALDGLAEALERAPRSPVRTLDVLPPGERTLLVETWNRTETVYPRERCIHQLFEAQVRRTPEAIAVVEGELAVSYAELDRRANRLAHRLIEEGVQPGDCVATLLERSVALVVAELAILKAGGAYVPLDPQAPAARRAWVVADCAARRVLTEADCVVEAGGAPDLELALSSEATAYVMYTSGSTGTPKGVAVPHRAVNRLVWNNGYAEFLVSDRVAWVGNPAFDISTLEVWAPLLHGGCLVIVSRASVLDAYALRAVVSAQRVSVLHLTSGLFAQVVDVLSDVLATLRLLLVGGDVVDVAAVRRVLGQHAPQALLHCYGPTESTTFATTYRVTAIAPEATRLPIGRPIGNTQIYLLDEHGALVPMGAVGELYVGGAGVARGYLDRPALTAERFVRDPFSPEPGARLYRTGDLARYLPDGNLEFLGRADQQVKIRGYRIELGEIEARLSEHRTVREAVVIAREDTAGDKRLVAYVTSDAPAGELVAALRQHLAEQLPEYMVPAAFVRLAELPLTPNGKLDRNALPAPDGEAVLTRAYEAPAGELEATLAAAWSELLGVAQIGRHDHFFELGGHSLLAVRLQSRLRGALGVELPLSALFSQPILAEQGAAIGSLLAERGVQALPPIGRVSRADRLALSFAQQRLWFLAQLGVSASYHMPLAVRLVGALDKAALQRSLDRLVARHEALRSVFVAVDGEPHVESLGELCGLSLVEDDLRDDPQASERLAGLRAHEAAAPFDLARGPLIRGRLVRLSDEEHVLLVTQHHIVSDGWSMGVFKRELGALYRAFAAGQDDPLPPLDIQYPDYAAWQRAWLSGDRLEAQVAYWRDRLAGAPALLELPTDRPRPPEQSFAAQALGVHLDAELTRGLRRVSQEHGTTLFMTLLGAWAAVLGRLASQDDVVIGTPTANRSRREIEGLIGFFVNTLALRIDLAGAPSLAELVARVRTTVLGAQDHQDLPFEQVVEVVAPPRRLDQTPVFQAMFAWQNQDDGSGLALDGLQVARVAGTPDTLKFDLELDLGELDGAIVGRFLYSSALFDASTIERYRGYLEAVLRALVADASQPVAQVDLISPVERTLLVETWNDTAAPYPRERCIHQLFEEQARRTPEAIAVVAGELALSYAELDRQANRLAHHLIGLGVGPETRVALCTERHPGMIVGVLAILKAGGAYVPLDPSYPRQRLEELVRDAAPLLVVCDAAGREAVGEHARTVALDDPSVERAPASAPAVAGLTAAQLAYVIYTSGSTGKPKGVMVEHRGVSNLAQAQIALFGVTAASRVVQFASLGFDASVSEVVMALGAGAALYLPTRAERSGRSELLAYLAKHAITHATLPPALLAGSAELAQLSSLQTLVLAGEAPSAALIEALPAGLQVFNAYGPTEATVCASAWSRADARADGAVPIGRPIANTQIYLLDGHGELVPRGAVGELYIGGAGVARGYLDRPALTAERFVRDPFGGAPGGRLYRTGDLARYLPDGNLEFLGRSDHQVKVRGYRIELGEIEARLSEHRTVREAVVIARADAAGDRRLVAYVTSDAPAGELAAALRQHLAEQLPESMVPSAFVRLAALPLTANGKLDRTALPAPDSDAVVARAYAAPAGAIEERLAAVWAELLGLERIGRHDHFFELGGHSLLAVRMQSRLGADLGVELPLATLFAKPTLAELATAIGTLLAKSDSHGRVAIDRVSRAGRLALSFAQQRLWFLAQLGAGATYHMPLATRLVGVLDKAALRASLDRLVARHEALRSVVVSVAGTPHVELLPETCGLSLIEDDLRDDPRASERLEALRAHEAAAPFDLARGPLIRGRLVRLSDEEHVLLVTQHHIVSDGWSMGVFRRELGALYRAFAAGQGDPLPPLDIQYADYAAWQRAWLSGDRLEAQVAYWRRSLAGAPALLALPTDRPRPQEQSFAAQALGVHLDAELTRGLRRVSQEHGTTLFMTLLAAWAMVLGRLAGQDDVVIGTPTANRSRREIEGLIGFFVNTLAMRIDLSGAPSLAELMARVRETALGAQDHQDLPFEQVVEVLAPPRRLDHTPVFQVMFAWQNQDDATRLELSGLTLEPVGGAPATLKFDLELNLSEVDGAIAGVFLYASALFDASTIERHRGYLEAVLRALVADASQPVAKVDLISPAERTLQIETWNRTKAVYPRERCIHQLFEDQARRTPEAIAVVEGELAVSYAELNRRANRLAHRLIEEGVQPGDCVATLLERGVTLVVAELAILKAGGVYVPLDPQAPAARRAWVVADCAARRVLTEDDCVVEAGAASDPELALSSEAAAYVMYTSGSTGMPKGVEVPHRGVNRLVWNNGYAEFLASDRVAWVGNPAFDISTLEVWAALLHGGCLVIVSRASVLDAQALRAVVSAQRVSVLHLTSGLFAQVVDVLGAVLARLRLLLVGGDVVDVAAVRRVLGQHAPQALLHCYGPTESTTFATTYRVTEVAPDAARLPIGRPIGNTQIYLLDGHGAPVPVGAVGELYVGGAGVARGYLHRPELTAERFVRDPFSPDPDARLYRTGDLARYLADGNLEFLGRADQQVKIRGYRIELGEIEARLSEHRTVRDAVVIAREDTAGDKRLVAYVTSDAPASDLVAALRQHLAEQLPEYMVPAAFVRLAALPLTPHGKLDRNALPAPDGAAVLTRAYEAPAGELEATVATLWSELLGVERIGRRDHFFELGGHSLLAVRLHSQLHEALGVELPLSALFSQPILAEQAAAIGSMIVERGVQALPPIGRVSRAGRLALSFAQQRLWFLAQLGVSANYHIPIGVRLVGTLDKAALRRSLDSLVARHEALRSVFVAVDGDPQVELLPASSGLSLVDVDLEQAPERLAALCAHEAVAPFDLERGPLIRGQLVRLSDEEHVLLVTQHHIVSDGWSMGVFKRELGALYRAFAAEQETPLSPLEIQYPDYAAWQRAWLSGDRLAAQVAYWRRSLAGAPALLELPTDRPRPQEQSFAAQALGVHLDAELTRGLRRVSQEHGTTLFMTVLGAWAAVLARLASQDDVVIGTPTANRSRREIEGLIGFFVNTLALRIDLSGEPSLAELLARARTAVLGAQDHQDLPFEQVVEEVAPPRRLDQTPVFQVMFVWQNQSDANAFELPGLHVEPVGTLPATLKFDLELTLSEVDGAIAGGFLYSSALFDASTIERHRGYLVAVLRALVADAGQPVTAVDLLDPAERTLLVETVHRTEAVSPSERCIHQLFEEQVRRTPDAIAVVQDSIALTYAELDRRANRLAHRLIALGVGPDARVVLCVARHPEMVVALLAILKAGGAYVPLDPSHPRQRLHELVRDAAPVLVVCDAASRETLAEAEVPLLALDEWTTSDDESAPEVPGLTPAQLAYVIYTSGSTGAPKGVMVEHRQLVASTLARMTHHEPPVVRFLLLSPLSFDSSVAGIFWSLVQGGSLHLPSAGENILTGLPAAIRSAAITHILCLPSVYGVLLSQAHRDDLASLRLCIVAGEEATIALCEQHRARVAAARLVNEYGPTEATVWCTYHVVSEATGPRVPIGRPIASARIYLLDAHGELVPRGTVGELYVGGAGVARGYLHRAELTAERFVRDPFRGEPGARMYRTGDLARYLPDGSLEFLGRRDHQVKVRGYRIELGEIEARLCEHPAVREAVVIAREDTDGDKRLVAYLTSAAPAETGELVATLRRHLFDRLPEYMVPSAFVRLAALPVTPNGKLDRKALPAPDGEAVVQRVYAAPEGEIEEILAGLWAKLLGVPHVGRHDHFFELGGHSLLAVRLQSRIAGELGVELPLSTLFAKPTLAELATAIGALRAERAVHARPAIGRVSRAGRLALSFAQQRLWFLAQLGASASYHMPMALRLVGALDLDALRRSLDRLVARHEALRSVVVSVDGQPRVELLPETCGLSLVDVDLATEAQATERLEALCAHQAVAPFDLERGPLIRGQLVRISDERHVLLVTQHHIVSDGWSMGVFMRELGALYRAFATGEEDPLSPLDIQYPDYAAWQRAWLSGDRLETQVAYWRRSLAGAPPLLELPTDRPRPSEQSFAAQSLGVQIDAELTRGLRRVSQEHGTTLFMTVLGAWAAVLARLAGQDDVVIGTPTANRSRREIEGLIGFFVNTLALRIDLSGEPSLAELLARVRAAALGAQDHQDLPFEQVVEVVAPPRRLDQTPVFQVMFVWQNQDNAAALELPGLHVEPVAAPPATLKFDLELTLSEVDGAIAGGFLYSSALFDADTIERHRGYLVAVLRALVADAGQPVTQIDLLGPAERTLLIETWNRTEAVYPRERCIHQLFEEQARRTPEAIAVVGGEVALSYAELDQRANRLAHRLIELGVGPDARVALCSERAPQLVVGVLAILKAGGAYLPLDPSYPRQRLHELVRDGEPVLVLCDARGRAALGEHIATLALDDPALATGEPASAPVVPGLTSAHLAYVIYTSGSTGTPKGVMVEHRGVSNYLAFAGATYAPSGGALVTTSLSFDATVTSLWTPLVHGSAVRLVSESEGMHGVAAQLHAHPDLLWKTTPSQLASVGEVMRADGATPALGAAVIGGEALAAATVRAWRDLQPGVRLINEYGPTETVVGCSVYEVPAVLGSASSVPIGRPIANTRLYLLDRHGEPVPRGAVGELYIGGAGVARGYLHRPELTAERFVVDRFCGEPGARLYRTGDLARYLPDGNLEFLGRTDDQVKIRGYRIEPGEIAARLSAHRTVREAVVIAREHAGDLRLVAYVTSDAPAGELVAALRQHLMEQLPEYMVPSAFVKLAELPRTANGKLDRKALPAPDAEAVLRRAYEAPAGEIEATLATVWAEILGLERVGRHDHFFELGGHSLLAITLMERLRRLGLGTAIRTLFATPILSQLAATLGSHVEVVVPPNVIQPDSETITPDQLPLIELAQTDIDQIIAGVPGGVANIQDIYALSPLQEGILFHHVLASEGDPYLGVSQLAFANRAVLDRYLAAVQEVVNRHDILRTALVWEGQSAPAQVVWRKAALIVTEGALPRPHRIDLTTAPLLRYAIEKEPGSERYQVLELQHHLIGDHSTLEILHAEVRAILDGRGEELAAPQPFRNLVAQARLGMGAAEHERFFRELLGDIDEPTTPFGLREVHRDGSGVSEARRMLPAALNDRLRAQARRLGVSLASLCHLAFGQVVARTSGREQVVFGTVLFGRMHAGPGADRAMGLFINTLPIRLDLDDTAIDDSVRRTHERLAALLRHEHAALALAQRCSGVAAPAPLFSALLNYRHNSPPPARDQNAHASDPLDGVEWMGGQERTNYPFTLSVDDFGRAVGLTAHVVQPLSPERVCDFMERALDGLAEALEHAPQRAVRTLDVLPPAERALLVETSNRTETVYPRERCIHQMFEEQVRRTPEAIAVVHDSITLTYAELDRQANRLAHHLIGLGVGPETRVALCTERHPGMIVGVLAILKAGGAYVPLDPSYPRQRLEELVRDAAPLLVVCDAAGREAVGEHVRAVALDDPAVERAPASAPAVAGLTAAQLAYVIYTSGSTGKPKGVMVEHRGVSNLAQAQIALFGVTAASRVVQFASLGFDASVSEVVMALGAGAALHLPTRAERSGRSELLAYLARHAITHATLPPALLAGSAELAQLSSLQTLVLAGEAPSAALIAALPAGLQVFNAYGPTEATVCASAWSRADARADGAVPIGRPIANTQIYLLDEHGELVPRGAVGEIYIGGAGVARGYLDRPALTAERFVRDPFGAPGGRLYRTGDLARYLPDGNLEFLGRSDHQVKVRGYRIELGEIEARLSEHRTVREAVVMARADAAGDQRLVAYVTSDAPAGELAAALRQHLAEQLPEYMVPSAFVRLAALPLTANGKLDRKALPAPDSDAVVARAYAAPRGALEETLATVWAELLGVDRVGRRDHFFELGGHSLVAVKFVERLRRLGIDAPLLLLYESPILEDLAQRITSKDERNDSRAVPARTSGSQLPLFFVPTGKGDYSYSFELARDLDPTLPIYALPWDMGEAPITVEALAARMVPLVQAVQARGPYRLAGYSSGGLLAYAIAEHLLAMGEVVSFIGLLDVGVPTPDHANSLSARQMVLEHILAKLETDAVARERVETLADNLSLRELVQEGERLGVLQKGRDTQSLVQLWEEIAAFEYAVRRYQPTSLPLAVHLFHSSESNQRGEPDSTGGWGRVLPSSSIHQIAVPGDHLTMMTDAAHRRILGALISQAVRRP